MSDSAVNSRLKQAFYDALAEIAKFMKLDILKAFDSGFGYDESGNKVTWSELTVEYMFKPPPRGRGGVFTPLLNVEGDLRHSIKAVANEATITTDVTSQKMKARGKGSISVAEISESLGVDRPHTNPSSKWLKGSPHVQKIIYKHLQTAYNELRRDGLW